MRVVVPIHNAVNERAWAEIMKWEAGQGGERCGGVKLVSFKGRPNDRTPRAWFYSLLGYVGVLYWPITLISLVTSLRTDIHHHSIAMTGLSTAAGRARGTLSTSTQGIPAALRPKICRSSLTCDQHSTAGMVSDYVRSGS